MSFFFINLTNMGIFDFLNGNSEKDILFNNELNDIINEFEIVLKSKNNMDYPPPFWYDIIVDRASYMINEVKAYEIKISEVESEWIYSHAEEYKNKYSSRSKEEVIDAMSLRIERFGFIYDTLLEFEKKLNALAKKYNKQDLQKSAYDQSYISYEDKKSYDSNNFIHILSECIVNRSSAYASLFGTIKYSLSFGMSQNDIKNLYTKFLFDEKVINGTNPFDKFGVSKSEALDIINDNIEEFNEKYGIEMQTQKENTLSSGYTKIKKRHSSMLSKLVIKKRYAVFTILCYIANSDGMTNDENKALQDILLELEIDVNEYNKSNMNGNEACDHLQDLNEQQKDEFSKFIILIVGADAEFSSQEMMFVDNVIKEIGLDDDILIKLTEKYW